jgi:hypothetical protein
MYHPVEKESKGDCPFYKKGTVPFTLGNVPFYSRIKKTRNFFLRIFVYEGVLSANREDYRGMLRRQRRSLENAR